MKKILKLLLLGFFFLGSFLFFSTSFAIYQTTPEMDMKFEKILQDGLYKKISKKSEKDQIIRLKTIESVFQSIIPKMKYSEKPLVKYLLEKIRKYREGIEYTIWVEGDIFTKGGMINSFSFTKDFIPFVDKKGKINFINSNLEKIWLNSRDDIFSTWKIPFKKYILVALKKKREKKRYEFNIIDENGKFLFDEGLDFVERGMHPNGSHDPEFKYVSFGKYLKIEKKGKINFFDENFNLLFEKWFNYSNMSLCLDGNFFVEDNGKINMIDGKGKLLRKYRVPGILLRGSKDKATNKLYAYIYKGEGDAMRYNIIDASGKLLSKDWFQKIGFFSQGYIPVSLNSKKEKDLIGPKGVLRHNFMDDKGNYLFKKWFFAYWISHINDGWFVSSSSIVHLLDKNMNARNNNKNIFNNIGCKDKHCVTTFITPFYDNIAKTRTIHYPFSGNAYSTYNFVDKNGKFLLKTNVDYLGFRINGFSEVEKKGKYNIINKTGEYICSEWFDDVILPYNGGNIAVKKNKKWAFVDKNCEYYIGNK